MISRRRHAQHNVHVLLDLFHVKVPHFALLVALLLGFVPDDINEGLFAVLVNKAGTIPVVSILFTSSKKPSSTTC